VRTGQLNRPPTCKHACLADPARVVKHVPSKVITRTLGHGHAAFSLVQEDGKIGLSLKKLQSCSCSLDKGQIVQVTSAAPPLNMLHFHRPNSLTALSSPHSSHGSFGSSRTSSNPDLGRSGGDYSQSQLLASAANKETFFARKQQENASRPEGLPPNQGGKYVGFGSGGSRPPPKPAASTKVLDDTFSMMTQVCLAALLSCNIGLLVLTCSRERCLLTALSNQEGSLDLPL
jgi:hypothetical protein